MEFLVLKVLLFAVALIDGIYLGVLVHELGHALVALVATKQSVTLKVGRSREPVKLKLGRLSMELGIAGFRYGSTSYDRTLETVPTQRWIIAGGPVATLVVTVCLGISLWWFEPWGWIWIGLFGLFVANFRILVTALWPMEYPNPENKEDVWLSDSLDFWRMGKR